MKNTKDLNKIILNHFLYTYQLSFIFANHFIKFPLNL